MITLMPVQQTEEDELFLYRLYAGTRMEEVAAFGWGAEEQQAFLRMQFELQRRSYALKYPSAKHELITFDRERIGQMLTDRTGERWTLIDISLLPDCRNRGVGTALLRQLQDEAARSGACICLHVYSDNRAQRLYSRMGFQIAAARSPYISMMWTPTRG